MEGVQRGGERRKGALDHALEDGDRHAVVRDGHPCPPGLLDAGQHLPAGEHAAAAVDDQAVVGQVVRVVPSCARVDLHVRPHVLAQPAGDLHAADVVLDGVVAARLGDQDPVIRSDVREHRGAAGQLHEVPLGPGKEDGERRAGHPAGSVTRHLENGLGVADGDVRSDTEAAARNAAYSLSFTTATAASQSRQSRMVCTCGRMSRPRGACRSMGTTSTAMPTPFPEERRSPIRGGGARNSSGQTSRRCCLKKERHFSLPPGSMLEQVHPAGDFSFSMARKSTEGASRSVLFTTRITGAFRARLGEDVFFVRRPGSRLQDDDNHVGTVEDLPRPRNRSPASCEVSSIPAVSRKTTGPMGRSSMGFSTTSVVVPGTRETMALIPLCFLFFCSSLTLFII